MWWCVFGTDPEASRLIFVASISERVTQLSASLSVGDSGVRGERRSNLPSLTGMRFFAALLVFFIHSLQPIGPVDPTGPLNPFADKGIASGMLKLFGPAGYLGVSFFFLLSGFVITWSARPGERVRAFWRRRLVKIFPNHIVMWALAMFFFAGAYTPMFTWLTNLFLVNSYVPKFDVQMSVNAPAWSLCSELLFYLLFPALIRPIRRIPVNRLWLWAGVLVACVGAVTLVTTYLIPDTPKNPYIPISPTQMWFNYTFPPMRLFEFVLGMVLARIVMAGRWPRIGVAPVLVLLGVGYWIAMEVQAPFNISLVMLVPFSVAICAAASADVRGARSFLTSRPMIWLGEISFGFYLCQGVVLFYGRPAILGTGTFSTPVAVLVMIGMFCATLLSGWLLHSCVEMPAMRLWSRSKADRKPADRAATRVAADAAVPAQAVAVEHSPVAEHSPVG